MDQTAFLAHMQKAMLTVLIASAPALGIAIIIGVSVGLIQALTQIQDQTLPQAVKLVAVMLALVILGPALAAQVANFASNTLDIFPALTR
ncbi:type III secretion system export apparatus subunit SctS (plasmid) [Ensifer adhaerens]|uniref:type III secretion system export apparatus subunit SctS n=1 Tax=Ensifer adhaerens TaxID=106592 RepID=UPI0021007E47|nr:type III secretion system export apparatus subunit SctS [Ensifer adhaerens]UTV41889.1 type III secretion system export apparatus subunit SctS [Ensifer adhaerens]